MDSASVDVATEVLIALPKIGASEPDTAAKVAKLLTKGDRDLRYAATFAIAQMGIQNDAAQIALQSNMRSDDLFLNTISAWAIAKTNPRDPAKAIATMKAIGDLAIANDPRVKEVAQLILSDLKATRNPR